MFGVRWAALALEAAGRREACGPRSPLVTHHASRITRCLPASLLLIALAAGGSMAQGGEKGWWPEDRPARVAKAAERPRGASGWLMWLYKNYVSQVDAIRTCRFEPTCGAYARQAIRTHGPLLGWLMGCDRAIRYHGDTTTYRRAVLDGHIRLLDPVGDNDFWFRRPFRKQQP